MNMWNFGFLVFGIYLGQEYNQQLPNVKQHFNKYFDEFQKSDFYKNLIKKNN